MDYGIFIYIVYFTPVQQPRVYTFIVKGYAVWSLPLMPDVPLLLASTQLDEDPQIEYHLKEHIKSMLSCLSSCIYTFLYFHKVSVITALIHAMHANKLPLYQHLGILVLWKIYLIPFLHVNEITYGSVNNFDAHNVTTFSRRKTRGYSKIFLVRADC